jgi:cytochrome c oxidase subunit 2
MASQDDYELAWGKTALGLTFLILIIIGAFILLGVGLPSHRQRADPLNLSSEFAEGAIRQVGINSYEVYITAGQFNFDPRTINVPVGAEVTFIITSVDVLHGFQIVGTNVNMMAVPGHVNSITHIFMSLENTFTSATNTADRAIT